MCINDGSGTRYNSVQNKESSIDLTLMSSEIAGITKWEVFNKILIGSDHYPIMIRVGIEVYQDESTKIAKWNFNKADWDKFQIINKSRCEELFRKHPTNVEEFNEKLVSIIIQSAEETIPKTKAGKGKKKCSLVGWKL